MVRRRQPQKYWGQWRPPASIVACRGCRRRDFRASRMHPLYTAGEAACEEPVHATCMRCGGQVLPCRRQGLWACRMHPLLMAGDRRRRGTSTGHEACGWHALWLSGAASGAASAHAACIHRCGCRRATGACSLHPLFRAVPAIFKARPQGKPHASLIDGRRCRRRGNRACRLHALRCGWQVRPPA